MEKKRLPILLLTISLCIPVLGFADAIILKSGKTVEGKITEKTDKYIKMNFQGVQGAEITYFLKDIERIEISNPEREKPPKIEDNIEINSESTAEEILQKTNYYYSIRDFNKVIELCELAIKKTNDSKLIAKINFSLSSSYLEKGIEAYERNKDDGFYKLSIQSAKKCLEVMPHSWQVLGNIGTVYFNMRDWKQAVFYFSEAKKYLDKNDSNYASIEYMCNIAEARSKGN